jgi:HEAT repeat protein
LLKYPVFVVDWDINKDIHSDSKVLSLSAIRFMAYSQKEMAKLILPGLLDNPDWRVKSVILSALGDLNVSTIIPEITACLDNPNWWVNFSARQALRKLGIANKDLPQMDNINERNIDVSQHVLNTF